MSEAFRSALTRAERRSTQDRPAQNATISAASAIDGKKIELTVLEWLVGELVVAHMNSDPWRAATSPALAVAFDTARLDRVAQAVAMAVAGGFSDASGEVADRIDDLFAVMTTLVPRFKSATISGAKLLENVAGQANLHRTMSEQLPKTAADYKKLLELVRKLEQQCPPRRADKANRKDAGFGFAGGGSITMEVLERDENGHAKRIKYTKVPDGQ